MNTQRKCIPDYISWEGINEGKSGIPSLFTIMVCTRNMAPPPVAKPHLYPRRVIDSDYNVIKQNSDLTELTGIDANTEEVKCHDQLSSSLCETDQCPLKQLLDNDDENSQLRYGDTETEVRQAIEFEMPNGETRLLTMYTEQILDELMEPGTVIQSFKDMTNLMQYQDSYPGNGDFQTD
ncbi:hypothetical protein [Halodesulfurarchaeum sp.]|uniref:hypothetical protein n=1 Tax=Halodesulfurarchaeum sp. TaxID=1980530 RepID=UPI002FC391F9